MFVGHALFAFALAVLFAEWRGWPTRRALTVGIVAGAFAALPDIDVVYALAAVDGGRFLGGGSVDPEAFWSAANAVHRSMTHSLVVAAVVGPAVGLWAVRHAPPRRKWIARATAVTLLLALVATATAVSGPLGTLVMGAFVGGAAALATLAARRTSLSPRLIALAAAAGLFTHPWGDLVTGEPPRLLYPLQTTLLDGRVILHSDPTIHLLGAFAIELAVVWLALLAVVRLTGRSVRLFSDRTAALGATYGAAAVVLVPPTLEVSYHFVFSILAVGTVCGVLAWYRSVPPIHTVVRPASYDRRAFRPDLAFVAIALAGTTIALVGYAVVYVALVS
ncbi:metal-dependent hydrolase [Halobellus rufus]|uniref:metal-dependent hydrolase n=1 Tax=Halobellus rufus TaxID=1448860 RepID=UPI000679D17C|nr:metal-dependent hydrolase [Halobellus rufus]